MWAASARSRILLLSGLMALPAACGDTTSDGDAATVVRDASERDAFAADARVQDVGTDSNLLDAGTDASLDAPPPPTRLGDHAAPGVLWLEPFSAAPGVVPRAGSPVLMEDLISTIADAKGRGFHTIVLAYIEYAGCFYYPSELTLPFARAFPAFLSGPLDPCTSPGPECFIPSEGLCTFLPEGDLLAAVFDEADRLNMNVFVGIGQSADPYLLLNIEADVGAPPSPMRDALAARISGAFQRSTSVAAEVVERYGSHRSFVGFYLGHEPSCIDVARNLWDPVRARLREIDATKHVIISPFQQLRSCFAAESVNEHIASLELHAVLYQDGVGGGADSLGRYTCGDAARDARIEELEAFYRDVRGDHSGLATEVWANVEAWTMSGYGRNGEFTLGDDPRDGLCGYGFAHAGPYERFERQHAAARAAGVDAVMVNEGLLLFNGRGTFRLSHDFERAPADTFGAAYEAALR